MRQGLGFLFLLFFIFSSAAQDSTRNKKVKILPVPAFGYAPETDTYVGAVSLFTLDLYQDDLTRTSNAKVEFNYTWRKQVIVEAQWNYFFREEKYYTQGIIHWSKYPDFYYGIGPETPASNELLYESKRFDIDFEVLKNLGNKVFSGFGVRYLDYFNVTTAPEANPFPELRDAYTYGFKYVILQDTRNNLLNSTSGHYYDLEIGYNFSDDNYTHVVIDLRKYHTFNDKWTVAGRFYNSLNFGNPPFYDYSFLGGDKFVRGYFYGRFRDQHLSTFQLETRAILFWRVGLAAFGGASAVYPNLNDGLNVKPNYGLGLRFVMDRKENVNLRFDYAVGADGETGFYVVFGESF